MINGAWGGRRRTEDGIEEGVTNPSPNMSNLPVETLEARYPIPGAKPTACGRIPVARVNIAAGARAD